VSVNKLRDEPANWSRANCECTGTLKGLERRVRHKFPPKRQKQPTRWHDIVIRKIEM